VSEFDKLKDESEDYARQHPQQVKEGEDADAGSTPYSPASAGL
jgi:hypothetical protein